MTVPSLLVGAVLLVLLAATGLLFAVQLILSRKERDEARTNLQETREEIARLKLELRRAEQLPSRNPNPVIQLKADGTVSYANRAADPVLKSLEVRNGRLLPDCFSVSFTEMLETGRVCRQEVACGDAFYLFSFAPQKESELINLYGLDITECRRAFEAARSAERRLQKTVDDLQRSNRDLEQFAYISSHDLQEPIRMVSSYVQLIKRRYQGQLDADADEFIEFAVEGTWRMNSLIEGLLQYSRVQTQAHPAERVDSNRLVQTVLRDLSRQIHEAEAAVEVEALPAVQGDRIQLGRVFQNLISNAIKFCADASPNIRISGAEEAACWHFRVEDNGIGVEPEYAEKIFGIFQRLHERGKFSGTGIGLAICKRIIERHGGNIWVEPVGGGGSVFHFTVRKDESDEWTGN